MPQKGEALKRYRREWYLKNREKIIERVKARHAANPKATVQRVKEWRKKNPDKVREHITGLDWHVDHIIPLKGRKVCGLHVWNNFAVIPATLNKRKSNSFHPY